MKKALLIILPLLLCLARPAAGQEILVVTASSAPPFRGMLDAFRDECISGQPLLGGVKSVQPTSIRELAVGEMGTAELAGVIRDRRPDLVLTIGDKALQAAIQADATTPLVYLLAAAPAQDSRGRRNVTGITMQIPAAVQLAAIRRHLPRVRRLGVLYDPIHSGPFVAEAQKAAGGGLTLVPEKVSDSQQVPARLEALAGHIDAFWMVPDLTVLNHTTLPGLMLFSLTNRVPIITFADKYLAHGAAVSVTYDLKAMARQAARLALTINAGTPADQLAPLSPDSVAVHLNDVVLRKLDIQINREGTQ